jgi:serine/threonine-protein kinase
VSESQDRLLDLACAVADGTVVDWANAESSAASDAERRQIAQMRLVHEMASDSFAPASDPPHESLLTPGGKPALDSSAPVTWGPLRVTEKIGRGRFGDVYRAWDPRLDREVALKLLRHRPADRDPLGSSVIEEGRMLARVRHPNIVTIHGAERINDRVGLWMELIDGETLHHVFEAGGPLAPADVAAIGGQVAQALEAVHRAGLIHRDIKAQNVMRDRVDGRILLMDFGTGRELATDAPHELAGTPLYLAPEVMAGEAATPQSDLYSLGVLLYWLASGAFPVPGHTLADIRRSHESGGPASVKTAASAMPPALAHVIDRLISPRPGDRYQTAAEVATALDAARATPRTSSSRFIVVSASVGVLVATAAWLAFAAPSIPTATPIPTSSPATAGPTESPAAIAQTSRPPSPAAAPVTTTLSVAPGPTPTAFVDRVQLVRAPPCIGIAQMFGMVCGEWPIRLQQQGRKPPAALVRFSYREQMLDTIAGVALPDQIGTSVQSPDGRSAAFVVLTPGGPPEIRVVRMAGKDVRVLARMPPSVRMAQLIGWAAHDGRLEVLMIRTDQTAAFVLVDSDTGAADTAAELPGLPQMVSRSTDGRIVYDVAQKDSLRRDVQICVLATGACRLLAPQEDAHEASPQFLPDGRVFFISDREHGAAAWRIDPNVPSAEPELLRVFGTAIVRPWGATGTGALALEVRVRTVEVYQADVQPGGATVTAMQRASLTPFETKRSPMWSPDRKSLAYLRGGGIVIQGINATISKAIPLDFDFDSSRLAWSPRGETLAVRSRSVPEIRLVDVVSGQITGQINLPRSPSGEEYVGNIGWLDDARLVAATTDAMWSVDRKGPSEQNQRKLWQAPAGHAIDHFSMSPDRLSAAIVLAGPAQASRLVHVSLADGATRDLLTLSHPAAVHAGEWMPDGRSVLAVQFTRLKSPLLPRGRLWRVPIDGAAAVFLGLEAGALADVSIDRDGRTLTFVAGGTEPELWLWTRTDFLPRTR